jgi:hypothetical protein
MGSAASTSQRGRGADRDQSAYLLTERARVDEQQRRVEPVEDQARKVLGLLVELDDVEPVDLLGAAEHRLVRPPGVSEHVQDRERDRDPDAGQHAQRGDAEERGDRQDELRGPQPPKASRARAGPPGTAKPRSRRRPARAGAGS